MRIPEQNLGAYGPPGFPRDIFSIYQPQAMERAMSQACRKSSRGGMGLRFASKAQMWIGFAFRQQNRCKHERYGKRKSGKVENLPAFASRSCVWNRI